MRLHLPLLAILLVPGACGEDSLRPVSDAAKGLLQVAREAIAAARTYVDEHRDEIRETVDRKFSKLADHIDDLQARIERAGRQAKPEWGEALDRLGEKKRVVEDALREVGEAGERAWDRVRPRVVQALDELEKAYDHCREQFE